MTIDWTDRSSYVEQWEGSCMKMKTGDQALSQNRRKFGLGGFLWDLWMGSFQYQHIASSTSMIFKWHHCKYSLETKDYFNWRNTWTAPYDREVSGGSFMLQIFKIRIVLHLRETVKLESSAIYKHCIDSLLNIYWHWWQKYDQNSEEDTFQTLWNCIFVYLSFGTTTIHKF